MARQQKQAPQTVRLVSQQGTKVRVAKSETKKYRARGFRTEAEVKAAEKSDESGDSGSTASK